MNPVFNESELEVLRNLPDVVRARERNRNVNFSATVSDTIRQRLEEKFEIALPSRLPFRWIQGDTPVHADVGASPFENTYLVYLTDGDGLFEVGEETYPIVAGHGFVFSEGTRHGVVQTNGTSRLMLGPMSESGFAVGAPGTNLSADGETTTIYIQQSGGFFYKLNEGGDLTAFTFPLTITNTSTNPSSNVLKVLFATDLTLSSNLDYIQLNSDGIQIGDTMLRPNGSKVVITIDDLSGYYGFLYTPGGQSNLAVYNIHVTTANGSTLGEGAGWLAQNQFGVNGANNIITNCSSDGPIPTTGGGIVGSSAASRNGGDISPSLTVLCCTSTGAIESGGGGILGESAGNGGGGIICGYCSSSGSIGSSAGGIYGPYAGNISGANVAAYLCYSSGSIGVGGGGIFGDHAATTGGHVDLGACYSTGNIGLGGGGIVGSNSGEMTVDQCYTTGNISAGGGGLIGSDFATPIYTNCYVSGGGVGSTGYMLAGSTDLGPEGSNNYSEYFYEASGWNSTNATSVLGDASVGAGMAPFIEVGPNQPYKVRGALPSPYTLTNIAEGFPTLYYDQEIHAGTATSAGVVPGYTYFILGINGADPASVPTVSINASSGAILTTRDTPVTVVYEPLVIIVYAISGSFYSVSAFNLSVTEALPAVSTSGTLDTKGKGFSFETYNALQLGQRLVVERPNNLNIRFNSFADYNKYLLAQVSFRR